MDYTVLPTLSGRPAFSNEQRQYYNEKQLEIKNVLGDFCFLDPDFKKLPFARYFNYELFLKTDLQNKATHPIHYYMLTLQDFYKYYEQKMRDLKTEFELNEITEEDFNNKTNELNIKKILADAEFNLSIKKKIKKYKYNYLN